MLTTINCPDNVRMLNNLQSAGISKKWDLHLFTEIDSDFRVMIHSGLIGKIDSNRNHTNIIKKMRW